MRDINFAEHRGSFGNGMKPPVVELARFKDENIATPRVVAASRDWVVYSLRNRASLRVLPRKQQSASTQIAYKQHTDAVTSAQFVNTRSNIVASTSQNELLVWYVDDENNVYTYFTFKANVVSFAWVPTANQPPDLLVMINQGAKKEAALLKASALIVKSAPETNGAVSKPDGTLLADASSLQSLRRDVVCDKALAVAASPIIAFSISDTTIITTSLGNLDAPAWQPCQGEQIVAMTVMPNELFIAVSMGSIFVWDVAGEPVPLQRFALGARRCTALHVTTGRATAFLTTGNPGGCEGVVFMMQPKIGAVATSCYDIDAPVVSTNSCAISGPNDEPRLHVDFANVLQVFLLQDAPWNSLDVGSPKSKAPPAVPAAAAPFSPQGGPSRAAVAARPAPVARGALAEGLPGSTEIDVLKTHIEAAIANTLSMMNVAKNVVTKDHEALLQEALKAQARVLTMAAGSAVGRTGAPSSVAFDAVIEGITAPVATALVDGIAAAVEDQLRSQLEGALRNVLTRQEKKKQRDAVAEIAKNLDTVVEDVMAQVQLTIQQKQSAYASRLIHYVSDVASEGWAAVQQLQQIVAQQQQQITALTQSGLVEEIKNLRAEVANLKRTRGQTDSELPRESVLANALNQIQQGDHATGLNWVLHFDDPNATIQLLNGCSKENRDLMLEDSAVSTQLWARITAHLVSVPTKETLDVALMWLNDILTEKDALKNNDQLMTSVQAYMNAFKGADLSNEAKTLLRSLFMVTRR